MNVHILILTKKVCKHSTVTIHIAILQKKKHVRFHCAGAFYNESTHPTQQIAVYHTATSYFMLICLNIKSLGSILYCWSTVLLLYTMLKLSAEIVLGLKNMESSTSFVWQQFILEQNQHNVRKQILLERFLYHHFCSQLNNNTICLHDEDIRKRNSMFNITQKVLQ